MNKKELAKLLLKHPLIKQIKESKGIDKKDFNRILAEEIMNEVSDEDRKDAYNQIASNLDNFDINQITDEELKSTLTTYVRAQTYLSSVINDLGKDVDEEDITELEKIKRIVNQLQDKTREINDKIKTMAQVSDKTETPKDNKITATAATSVATGLEQAAKEGTPESITQAVNDAEETTNNAADGVKQVASGDQGETQDNQQAGEKPTSTAVTTQGWSNAKKAADAKISQGATLEQIQNSLKDLGSFKKFWNVRGGEEAKLNQARNLFEEGYFNDLLAKVSQEAEQENSEEKVKEEVTNLVATYQAFMDFLLNPKIDIDAQRLASTIGQAKQQSEPPKTEEDFKKQFIEPLVDTTEATIGQSQQDYIAIAEQVIQKAPDLFTEEDLAVEGMKEFIGWYFDGIASGRLNEGLGDLGQDMERRVKSYQGTNSNKIKKHINKDSERWKSIFTKLEEMIAGGEISIDSKPEPEKEIKGLLPEPTQEEAQQQGQEAAKDDASRENAGYAQIYSELLPEMNIFFSAPGEKELGFMEQFLLRRQAAQLWSLIGGLQKILQTDEMKAFTRQGEKTAAGLEDQTSPKQDGQNLQEQEEGEVTISQEDQVSIKTDLIAFLKSLRALKALVSSYEKNMTRVSVDPALDGSSLKERINEMLPRTQDSIAKMFERILEAFKKATELEAQEQQPEPSNQEPTQGQSEQEQMEEMAILEALEGIIMEDADREKNIQLVDGIYNEMRAIFQPEEDPSNSAGLQGMMSKGDKTGAEGEARKMLDLAKKEEFINLFPGGMLGEGGVPVTVKEASDALSKLIAGMVDIMKDVIMLAKGETIPQAKLNVILAKLKEIADTIQKFFKVPSKISKEKAKEIEKKDLENPDNQSLTDTPAKPESGGIKLPELDPNREMFTDPDEEEAEEFPPLETDKNDEEFGQKFETLQEIFKRINTRELMGASGFSRKEQLLNSGRLNLLAAILINNFLTETDELGPEINTDTTPPTEPVKEEVTNQDRNDFINKLNGLSVDTKIVDSIKTFLVDLAQQKQKPEFYKHYENLLKLKDKPETLKKVKVFLEKVFEKIQELKKQKVVYKDFGKNLETLKMLDKMPLRIQETSTVVESLKPIILKMLNEHYSQKF